MARLDRNWLHGNHVTHHIKNAKGLNRQNTQELHDALIGVTTDLLGAIQSSQLLMSLYQQQLEKLWGNKLVPKWLRQPLYKLNDTQIKALLNQAAQRFEPTQETISNLLLRDKKWALLAEFHEYQKLLPGNPVKAVNKSPRLQALIDENNDQNGLIIDKAYQSLSGFERLRQISKLTFKHIHNLNGGSNRSKRLVNVDFDVETTVAENAMKDSNNAKTAKDNGLEK
ncbi:hypothetical protein ACYATO_08810 [Lactobacillaceae bacterium Melli_B3]